MMIITDSSSRAQAIARSTALMKFSENEPVLFAKRRSAEPLRLTDAAAKDRHRPAARDFERDIGTAPTGDGRDPFNDVLARSRTFSQLATCTIILAFIAARLACVTH